MKLWKTYGGLGFEDQFLETDHHPRVFKLKSEVEPVDWSLNFNCM